jgi:cysteinyl-tRNA synthetase|eukprot:TRINITY_DN68013_c0_g1_i1.p1 TRINITY_DN68013_c0_g1~~TRINITY_DN68013_c0_g1_i1.p1  ORF type:complete len:446 (+),score=61.31 TRINITY_DN68013_c0_g1_i1:81-1340(+)
MTMAKRDRSRSPTGTSVATEEIIRMVVAREKARFSKDWSGADMLRDQLSGAGVKLFDKANTWKAGDGRSGSIPTFSQIESGDIPGSVSIPQGNSGLSNCNMGSGDMSLGDPEIAHIKNLVLMREQARAAKNFDESDRIRDELKSNGVEVYDKEKLWRSASGKAGIIVGYLSNTTPTNTEINTLVGQREKARQGSDWSLADMIRDELKSAGVEIFDKEKSWRAADGRSGSVPSWMEIVGGSTGSMGAVVPMMGGCGGGGGGGCGSAPADIKAQIVQAALSNAQNPVTAQRTLQMLKQCANMPAGHVPQQYSSPPSSHAYAPNPSQNMPMITAAKSSPEVQQVLEFIGRCQSTGSPVSDVDISWLVETRERLRHKRDFAGSDEVRQAMRSQIGVELYEKEKRWQASDGRQGEIPSWTTLGL